MPNNGGIAYNIRFTIDCIMLQLLIQSTETPGTILDRP